MQTTSIVQSFNSQSVTAILNLGNEISSQIKYREPAGQKVDASDDGDSPQMMVNPKRGRKKCDAG